MLGQKPVLAILARRLTINGGQARRAEGVPLIRSATTIARLLQLEGSVGVVRHGRSRICW